MFIDQPLPHIARIHPQAKVFGDLRALEMAHGITPVQTYYPSLNFCIDRNMVNSGMNGARTLILQVLATSFMTGLIWFVQVVHYPLMEGWPHDQFGNWEMAHRDRTGLVVIPPMLIEGVVAVWLLFHRPRGVHPLLPIVGIMAILGIWASTFFLQVPCHLRLSTGWDAQTLSFLVNSNWIRTILWSFRMALSVGMVWQFWLASKPALADLASLQQDT